MEKRVRPTWDEYFINIMKEVGERGTCSRGRTGCVMVKDNRILCTGYVGSPAGTVHCDDAGHEMHEVIHTNGDKTEHCIRTAHAEQNAIADAARRGVSLSGATCYVKMTPCYTCAKMIINAGIEKVVALYRYPSGEARTLAIFEEAGVSFVAVSQEFNKYE